MADKRNEDRSRETERELIDISRLSDEEIFEKYRTEPDGLNQVEAAERLEEYGRNIIDIKNENSLLSRIKDALINPFNIVLMVVAIVLAKRSSPYSRKIRVSSSTLYPLTTSAAVMVPL